MEQKNIHLLEIYFLDKKEPERINGILDYSKKMIFILEIDDKLPGGYKEKGMINMDNIVKVEIIEKIGCIGFSSDECKL